MKARSTSLAASRTAAAARDHPHRPMISSTDVISQGQK
jgi:hypothetical protein